jgi:hypothetical protein
MEPRSAAAPGSIGSPSALSFPAARQGDPMHPGERLMSEDPKVDLNRASAVQPKEIKGLGKSPAEEIVRYRGKKGRFARSTRSTRCCISATSRRVSAGRSRPASRCRVKGACLAAPQPHGNRLGSPLRYRLSGVTPRLQAVRFCMNLRNQV